MSPDTICPFAAKAAHGLDPSPNVADLVESAVQRLDDLRKSDSHHLTEVANLRAAHSRELRKAETDRLDAIRAVDNGAVNRAAEVATTQASTLATQVATSAETLRTQVAAAAQAATIALAAALEPVQKDIADLRRAQYEAQGQKTQVVETQSRSSNWGLWVGIAVAAFIGFNTLLLTGVGVILTIYLNRG